MEVVLISDMGRHDANMLIRRLNQAGISSFCKEQGYGSLERIIRGRNHIDRHLIIIKQSDFPKAEEIYRDFELRRDAHNEKARNICPKCGSLQPIVIPRKLNIFQKLFYTGTSPLLCTKCKNEWY